MNDREVIVNLWYVCDVEGVIYSLRAKAYVAEGTDEDKLSFLKDRAQLDYLIAEPFEVTERFHIHIESEPGAKRMPVGHTMMLKTLDTPIALFEDALKILENRFPAQSNLSIPEDPLVCITSLKQNSQGIIEPSISGEMRF